MYAPDDHAVTLEGTVVCDDNAPAAVLQVALTYGDRRVVKPLRARFVLVTATGQRVSIKTRDETAVEGLATTTHCARWEVLAATDAGRRVASEAPPTEAWVSLTEARVRAGDRVWVEAASVQRGAHAPGAPDTARALRGWGSRRAARRARARRRRRLKGHEFSRRWRSGRSRKPQGHRRRPRMGGCGTVRPRRWVCRCGIRGCW